MKLFRRIFTDRTSLILGLALIALIVARFAILPISPPGFYTDEAASQGHVHSMLQNQTNSNGEKWPFYSLSLGGGFTTPIYLYPLVGWSAIFGTDPLTIRAFSQFATVLAILLFALSMRLHFGRRAGLIAGVIAAALPWGWLQGSLAWDPALVPLMVSIGLLGWSLLMTQSSGGRRTLGYILLPLGFILLAYVYPPYWVSAPLLMAGAYLLLLKYQRIPWRALLITAVLSAIAVIPLATFILAPGTLGRSSAISVFHDASLVEAAGRFVQNILLLINPVFLFIFGDANPRQSTGIQGMLGLAALIPMIVVTWQVIRKWLRRKTLFKGTEYRLVIIASGAYLLSLIGSALTAEGQPHSLRSCAAWIFVAIIIVIGWLLILRSKKKWLIQLAIVIAVISILAYAVDLTVFFPERAYDAYLR